MTERIERLIRDVREARAPICTQKFQIASEVLKENRDASPWWKRVLILEAYLDRMPVYIPEDELIVGEGASKRYGVELNYEFGMWSTEELAGMQEECTWCRLDDEELAFCKAYNDDPDKVVAQSLQGICADYYKHDPALLGVLFSGLKGWKSLEDGVKMTAWGNGGIGHFPNVSLAVPLYERVLHEGATGIIARCKEQLSKVSYAEVDCLEKIDFWQGLIRVYEAWIRFANRYADCAEQDAKTAEPARAAELRRIAEICRNVPANPARNFREAIQACWFTWIMMPSPTNSVGRFDQYMYPYYKADLAHGELTREDALELLENLKTRSEAIVAIRGSQTRGGSSGGARWYNYTIGGVDADGNDATNDLTYLLIEASMETQLPNHTLTLRVHENTPPALMQKAMELVKTGIGMPAFVSDREYIRFFTEHGVPLEDARNYAISGCLDGNIPGKTRIAGGAITSNPEILDIFLHNGVSRFSGKQAGIDVGDPCSFATFEDFKAAFYRQQEYLLQKLAQICNITIMVDAKYNMDPFYSGLMEGCIEEGKELVNRQFKPFDNINMISMVGGINVVDSLAAIKYWIFDKKKYTVAELLTAIDANWEGYEQMRRDFQSAPRYGNNDPYVDEIATDYYDCFASQIEACPTQFGHCITAGISVSTHQMTGKRLGASPEGRKAGEIMADGSTSPEQGADHNGPLALFGSAMKIHQNRYNATLMNQKFHPSALKTPEDMQKLALATKTYLTNGGKHVQYNVTDLETLLDAQKHPELHKDLIVRVAGYSAYFINLTPLVQKEVIDRTGYAQTE